MQHRFFNRIRLSKVQITFLLTGFLATCWFLVRFIQKPSRISYPCMRASAPIMSGFILYLAAFFGSWLGLTQLKKYSARAKFGTAVFFGLLLMISVFALINAPQQPAQARSARLAVLEDPNTPIGTPQGYWPGRVVWVMDKMVTSDMVGEEKWYMKTSQAKVRTMLSDGIKKYADTTGLATAWDCLFRYFNYHHGKGWVGYTAGEKIMIKLNHTNMNAGGHNMGDWMNSTPELVRALLEQLIDSLGIAQENITIGDPYRGFPNETYDICHVDYPDVHYIEGSGTNGREQTVIAPEHVFFTSDGNFESRLPQAYMEASYLINMPCLKSHGSAGITIAAKNHQGSMVGDDQNAASQYMGPYLHYDYPDNDDNRRMGMYRHLTDYMAHSKLGGNTLIYIVDAIWAGRDWMGVVEKFGMKPFNNDYPNSLFISQDAVAIESVSFDILYQEYTAFPANHNNEVFPLWEGVQDYIHQAASPANWPAGIHYDPDHADHHQPVGSLGVHEHWNNSTDKKYSVNLTGEKGGIHLVTVPFGLVSTVKVNYSHEMHQTGVTEHEGGSLKLFPNPASKQINISYTLSNESSILINLYSMNGKLMTTLFQGTEAGGAQTHQFSIQLTPGIYICKMSAVHNGETEIFSTRLAVK
ncbi:MAG: DUF362 domain-containing protein [Bacteroidales bacterium]